MKRSLIVACLILFGCGKSELTDKEKSIAMLQIVHYASRLPPGATRETRFNAEYNDYYKSVAADYKFLQMTPRDDDGYYFFISRPARSITPMSEGIGGSLVLKNDSLVEYEEIFRMWKMPDTTMQVRGKLLFDRMIDGRDLSLYYPRITGDKYIEVPDGRFVFDKQKRNWVDTQAPELK